MSESPVARRPRRWPWLWLAFPLVALQVYVIVYLSIVRATKIQISRVWQLEMQLGRPFSHINGKVLCILYPQYAEDYTLDQILFHVFAPAHYLDRKMRPDYWIPIMDGPEPPSAE